MKKQDVQIGKVYLVTVSGKRARVRLTNESPYGGYDGVNEDTHRKVRIKTAGRLQREIKDPEARPTLNQPEPEAIPAQPEVEGQDVQAAAEEPMNEEPLADERMTEEPDQATAEAQPEPEPAPEPQAAPEVAQAADTPPEEPSPDQQQEATAEAPSGDDAPQDAAPEPTEAPQETRLSKLTVEELQKLYAEVIQRETSSTSKAYLVWKIRQAQKGRIPVGPRTRRASATGPCRVLPLRMEVELVEQLDEARQRLGLSSRMELFRRSLHAFLLEAGEVRVAEMFAPTPEA